MDFKHVTNDEIAFEWLKDHKDKAHYVIDCPMCTLTFLDCVEYFANKNGLIDSKQEAIDQFDTMIDEMLQGEIDETLKSMRISISDVFKNWMKCKLSNGKLHQEQIDNYFYCGKHK